MKPAPFDYCRPTTVAEAVEALSADESGRVLAGGQSLIPAMNFRLTDVSLLVDIRRVEGLDRVASDPGGVTVGAAATQSRVLGDDDAAAAVPGLRAALRHVGHLQIRNRGTVCGSLAHADPGDFAVAGLVAVLEAEAGAVRTARLDGDAVRSCLMLAVQADGAEVRTVEDLAPGSESLSPMQQAFHENHALQCGFCTAGFLMTLESVDPDEWREPDRIIELLSGNLCRCTGYQNIVSAVAQAWGVEEASPGSEGESHGPSR